MNRDRSVQQVRWFGVALASAMTRSVVHFYPSTSGVSAPYNVVCRVSLFGRNFDRKSVTLEGARLSQPDGVRLEEIFPGLGDTAAGVFGVEFEISSNQPRIDLTCSWCVIESIHGANALRYVLPQEPAPSEDVVARAPLAALAVKDALTISSIIAVNATIHGVQPEIFTQRIVESGPAEEQLIRAESVPPQQAIEIPFPDEVWQQSVPEEWPFGLVRSRAVYVRQQPSAGVRYFLLAREALTKRPVSIIPLTEAL